MGFLSDAFGQEKNPATAPASPYGVINAGHVAIPSDCYGVLLQAIYLAASGETKENLEDVTASREYPDIVTHPRELASAYGYTSNLQVLASSLTEEWLASFKKMSECVHQTKTEQPDFVRLIGYANQRTRWDAPMKLSSHMGAQYIVGEAYTVLARAPNGSEVVHVEMDGGVLMSFAMIDYMDERGAGEWIVDSLKAISSEGMATIALPKFEVYQEIDFERIPALGFLFSQKAELDFGSGPCQLAASTETRIALDEGGLNIPRRFTRTVDHEKVDIEIDTPFIVVFSYPSGSNIQRLPTLIAKVEHPLEIGVKLHKPLERVAEYDPPHYKETFQPETSSEFELEPEEVAFSQFRT